MLKTEKFLKEAFAGESQSSCKYLAFSKKADEEGFHQAARLFRAAAESEKIHAYNHLRALKEIRSTWENISEAIEGETHESKFEYLGMIKNAEEEGNKEAVVSFTYANQTEKIHTELFKKALQDLVKDEKVIYYICSVCGCTVENNPPDPCLICNNTSANNFIKIE